jgi:hypothetical protein
MLIGYQVIGEAGFKMQDTNVKRGFDPLLPDIVNQNTNSLLDTTLETVEKP